MDEDTCLGCCEKAFEKHRSFFHDVKCIVFDDAQCNAKDWKLTLYDGESKNFKLPETLKEFVYEDTKYRDNIESVAVKKGCSLHVYLGKKDLNLTFL